MVEKGGDAVLEEPALLGVVRGVEQLPGAVSLPHFRDETRKSAEAREDPTFAKSLLEGSETRTAEPTRGPSVPELPRRLAEVRTEMPQLFAVKER